MGNLMIPSTFSASQLQKRENSFSRQIRGNRYERAHAGQHFSWNAESTQQCTYVFQGQE